MSADSPIKNWKERVALWLIEQKEKIACAFSANQKGLNFLGQCMEIASAVSAAEKITTVPEINY
jgi:dsDNA-binding SOS-regulon protein